MPRTDRMLIGAAALAASSLLAPSSAEAACAVSTVGVAFGVYNAISPADDLSTGTVNVNCHPSDDAPVVALSAGSSGSILARRMQNGPTNLNYNLYTDINRTIIWGNGTQGVTVTLTGGTVSGGRRRYARTIYGRIQALQTVGVGLYTDQLIVTVTW